MLCVCWLASETNNLIINSELMREGKQQQEIDSDSSQSEQVRLNPEIF